MNKVGWGFWKSRRGGKNIRMWDSLDKLVLALQMWKGQKQGMRTDSRCLKRQEVTPPLELQRGSRLAVTEFSLVRPCWTSDPQNYKMTHSWFSNLKKMIDCNCWKELHRSSSAIVMKMGVGHGMTFQGHTASCPKNWRNIVSFWRDRKGTENEEVIVLILSEKEQIQEVK
jgi:hypothetical protein